MNRCPSGHPVAANLKFCTVCGQPLRAEDSAIVTPPPSRRTSLIVAALTPLAIAALISGVLIGISGSSSSDAGPIGSSTTTTLNPVPAALAAWTTIGPSLPDPTTLSSIQIYDGIPTVVTGDGVPSGAWSSKSFVAVWEYRAGQWAKVLDRNLGLPVLDIQFVDLTDDGISEALIHGATASGPGASFVLGHSSLGWRLIPFSPRRGDSPGGPIGFDSSPNFYSMTRTCVPSCAQGTVAYTYWKYDPATDDFLEVK